MKNIFIIHGSYGYPGENWFPWLKNQLETLGNKVYVPEFPIPKNDEGHDLDMWLKKFEEYRQFVNKDTIIVAHSRGCSFAFQLLPVLNIKIDSLYLIAPFVDYDQWRPDVYKEYDSFQARPYLWKKIRKLASHIEVFQSTNDVIPLSEGQFVADWLKAKMNIFKDAGHFNIASYKRFKEFPELLEIIKTRL